MTATEEKWVIKPAMQLQVQLQAGLLYCAPLYSIDRALVLSIFLFHIYHLASVSLHLRSTPDPKGRHT